LKKEETDLGNRFDISGRGEDESDYQKLGTNQKNIADKNIQVLRTLISYPTRDMVGVLSGETVTWYLSVGKKEAQIH